MKTQEEIAKEKIELIFTGLEWCTKYKGYREITRQEDKNNQKALFYDQTWIRLITRIKNYIEDKNNLIDLYDVLKNSNKFDAELKEIICQFLKKEGKKRDLIYFMSQEEGQKLINEIFN